MAKIAQSELLFGDLGNEIVIGDGSMNDQRLRVMDLDDRILQRRYDVLNGKQPSDEILDIFALKEIAENLLKY